MFQWEGKASLKTVAFHYWFMLLLGLGFFPLAIQHWYGCSDLLEILWNLTCLVTCRSSFKIILVFAGFLPLSSFKWLCQQNLDGRWQSVTGEFLEGYFCLVLLVLSIGGMAILEAGHLGTFSGAGSFQGLHSKSVASQVSKPKYFILHDFWKIPSLLPTPSYSCSSPTLSFTLKKDLWFIDQKKGFFSTFWEFGFIINMPMYILPQLLIWQRCCFVLNLLTLCMSVTTYSCIVVLSVEMPGLI